MDFLEKNSKAAVTAGSVRPASTLTHLPAAPHSAPAQRGGLYAEVDGYPLGTRIDPQREGKKFARALEGQNFSRLLVYGLGLGYHLEAALESFPALERLAVVEANPAILAAALTHRDLTSLLNDPRFVLITGGDEAEVSRLLSGLLEGDADQWHIAVHQPSYRLMPKGFDRIRNLMESMQSDRRYATVMGTREQGNIAANIPALAAAPGGGDLFGSLTGRPALLAGAGPSLDRCLPLLKAFSQSVYLLAVDTALEPLAANGITPDAVFSVDPQPESALHFYRHTARELFFIPTTHPAPVVQHAGRRWLLIKQGQTAFQPAEGLLADKGVINAGSSVSCFGLELLVRMGADRIAFAGQDFCFPGGVSYNRRTMQERDPLYASGGDDGFQEMHEPLPVELADGTRGKTHANLISYLKSFEAIIADRPDVRFFNLDPRGAIVAGARNIRCPGEAEAFIGRDGVKPHPPLKEEEDKKVLAELTALFVE